MDSRSLLRHAFLALCGLLLPCFHSFLSAEQRELKVEQTEKVDAVLVLDASGSMRLTDPAHLRAEGAKLFIQFLKSGDRLGIIGFSDAAQTIRPLSDYAPDQTQAIAKDIEKVGNVGEYTDLFVGVKAAGEMLRASKREGATPTIVLLSDGKMDPAPAAGTAGSLTSDLLNKILPDFKAEGIRVHTLAFSDLADKDLLAQIAIATEGSHFFTPTSDKVHESYANLFLAVKKPQMLPLTSKGFKIDSDIEEATFYINGEEGAQVRLLSPSGKEISATTVQDGLRWFKGQKFDVITVTKPEVGDWKVSGLPTNDGFATVLTNLKLVTDWPISIHLGTPSLLQARLYEAEKPIVLPEMTQAIRYAFQITPTDRISEPVVREALYDDGTHGDKIANDGIFSFLVDLKEIGEYKLQIVAQAPTFERRQQLAFRVKPRVVTLSVSGGDDVHESHAKPAAHGDEHSAAGHDEHAHGGEHDAVPEHDGHATESAKTGDSFLVELSQEVAGLKDIEVKVVALDKNKKRYVLPTSSAGDALTFRAPAAAIPHDGTYQVQAFLTAETKKKTHVREESNIITFEKVTAAGEEPEVRVIVAEEKPVEEAPSPFLPLLMLTIINAGAAVAGFWLLKKAQSEVSFKVPEFESLDDVKAVITHLEAAAAAGEIDINDARLADDNIAGLKFYKAGLSATVSSIPAAPLEPVVESTQTEPASEAQVETESPPAAEEASAESNGQPESEAPKEPVNEEAEQ